MSNLGGASISTEQLKARYVGTGELLLKTNSGNCPVRPTACSRRPSYHRRERRGGRELCYQEQNFFYLFGARFSQVASIFLLSFQRLIGILNTFVDFFVLLLKLSNPPLLLRRKLLFSLSLFFFRNVSISHTTGHADMSKQYVY